MRIALLQINPTAGDLGGNSALIVAGARRARELGADLAVTPELALMGYLPRDLLMNRGFVQRSCRRAGPDRRGIEGRAAGAGGRRDAESRRTSAGRCSTAPCCSRTAPSGRPFTRRCCPPTTSSTRTATSSRLPSPEILDLDGCRLGISICEDVWNDRDFWKRRRYHHDPIEVLARKGAQAIVNLSASPFTVGKQLLREQMLGQMARKVRLPVVIVNQVGGNDDLIFDGRSAAFDASGRLFARAKGFADDVLVVDLRRDRTRSRRTTSRPRRRSGTRSCSASAITRARRASGKVLLGLSGGIDSALTAAIAADAMGPENVLGVMMPSVYSSQGSVDDSEELARNLGIQHPDAADRADHEAPTSDTLADAFRGLPPDVTEENIQSRIRGNLLMALSNKFGSLLLTTGNKSEMAVGYCTLYGDMNGGLAVIADLPKMMVYRVSRWRNQRGAGHSRGDPDQGALGRAAARPDRSGQPAALRPAGPDSGAARRAVAIGRRDHRARLRRGDRAPGAAAGADGGVQAQAGRPGAESDLARVRHRMANADRSTGIAVKNCSASTTTGKSRSQSSSGFPEPAHYAPTRPRSSFWTPRRASRNPQPGWPSGRRGRTPEHSR